MGTAPALAPQVRRAFIAVCYMHDEGNTEACYITERDNAPPVESRDALVNIAKTLAGGECDVVAIIETMPLDPEQMDLDEFKGMMTEGDDGVIVFTFPPRDA